MKKLCLVLGLMLIASLLAACGGSSDSSDSTSASSSDSTSASSGGDGLSKSDWIAQADDICSNYEDETDDLQDEYETLATSSSSSHEDLTRVADILRQVEAMAEDETDALRQLEPPSEGAATVDSMISKVETANEIGLRAADALEHVEGQKLAAIISEGDKVKDEASDLAEGYGLKVCGS